MQDEEDRCDGLILNNVGFGSLRLWRIHYPSRRLLAFDEAFRKRINPRRALAHRKYGCDGVVCGHVHAPVIKPLGELTYLQLWRLDRKLHSVTGMNRCMHIFPTDSHRGI